MKKIIDILFDAKTAINAAANIFQNSYHYAFSLDDKGLVLVAEKGSWKSVAMSDVEGNYFYIRTNGKITSAATPARGYADHCGVTITESYPFAVVAIVTDADEFALKDVIVNALLKSGLFVRDQYIDAPSIIKGELSGFKDAALNVIKSRLAGKTLVRIDFVLERIFSPNDCDYAICKNC